MSSTPSGPLRVLAAGPLSAADGRAETAADLPELLRWLRAGRVAADARVLLPDGRVVGLMSLPGAAEAAPSAALADDPWAAWDGAAAPPSAGRSAPALGSAAPAPIDVIDLPEAALEPVSLPTPAPRPVEARASAARRPPQPPPPSELVDLPVGALEPVTGEPAPKGRFVISSAPRPRAAAPAAPAPAPAAPLQSAPLPRERPARRPPPAAPLELSPRRAAQLDAVPASPVAAPDESPPDDNVIAFPSERARPRMSGSHALDLRDLQAPERQPEPRPAPTVAPTRWGRLGLIGALCALAAAGANYSVRSTAMTAFPPLPPELGGPPLRPPSPPVAPPPAPAPVVEPVAATSPGLAAAPPVVGTPAGPSDAEYADLERALREVLPAGPLAPRDGADLEDKLLVELSAMRLRGVKVKAKVVDRKGGAKGPPAAVELRVQISVIEADLDRDIAAVGLIVGRAEAVAELRAPKVELLIEGLPEGRVRRTLDGERARQFYLGRLSLLDFLTG